MKIAKDLKVKNTNSSKSFSKIKKKKHMKIKNVDKLKHIKDVVSGAPNTESSVVKKSKKLDKKSKSNEEFIKISKKSKKDKKSVKAPKVQKSSPEELIKENGVKKAEKKLKSGKTKSSEKPKKKKSHMDDLAGLEKLDPEFYEFLKKNDKQLLEFNVFDSDDDDKSDDDQPDDDDEPHLNPKTVEEESDDDEEGTDNEENDQKFHKPSSDLEVASDESDFEDDMNETADGMQKVTLNLLRQWQLQLEQPNVPIDIVRKVIQAFGSALASISRDGDENAKAAGAFKVVGSATFNGVVQLCVLHLQPAIMRILGLKPDSTTPIYKTKKWVKVRSCLRFYLTDLIGLIEQVSSPKVLGVLLKHLHQISNFVAAYTTLGKSILKRLIVLWATGDETVRVLAFLCILKITRNQQQSMLHNVLKAMYLSYVRNSKFVSPNSLPGINFMRRSLMEMFALDLKVSYQHVFLYIRQLAIHLRNAVILKKKNSYQAVYNWPYINSLRLWADLLGSTSYSPILQPLVYPLVTITMGVIRLIPTAQYFPLRFHCIQLLINLAKEVPTYIPVLPLIIEVFRSNTFNKKHTAVSMRPIQFTCILRLNKKQLSENGFRDEVVEQVCSLTLEFLEHFSSSIGFPELVVLPVVWIKDYLKNCKNSNHSRKVKQLLDKIQENARFVDQERDKINVALTEEEQVQAWERKLAEKKTPLSIYYESWVKTHEIKKRRQAAQVDKINDDYDLPKMQKNKKKENVAIRNEKGEVELFPSDSEDEEDTGLAKLSISDDEEEPVDEEYGEEEGDEDEKDEAKETSKKNKSKNKKKQKPTEQVNEEDDEDENVGDDIDIVKDLDLDDW